MGSICSTHFPLELGLALFTRLNHFRNCSRQIRVVWLRIHQQPRMVYSNCWPMKSSRILHPRLRQMCLSVRLRIPAIVLRSRRQSQKLGFTYLLPCFARRRRGHSFLMRSAQTLGSEGYSSSRATVVRVRRSLLLRYRRK